MFASGDDDTICAVITPQGYGGVSVIRLSGSLSWKMVSSLCNNLPYAPVSHHVYYTYICSKTKEQIDEVFITFFENGRSFTGEETVEISCHGNPIITASILKELVDSGARLARRGEFTYRAFLSGRIDLVQAESVLSLIESQSLAAKNESLRQLKGMLSDGLEKLESEITWCLAHLEASIDFSTENIDVINHSELHSRLSDLKGELNHLLSSYEQGRLFKSGIQVVIMGPPNVGKSSLLNLLSGSDRSIVSSTPGTTRDLVDVRISHGGLMIQFYDTAGLRSFTEDDIEKKGMTKALQAMSQANIVLLVFDVTQISDEEYLKQYSYFFEEISKNKASNTFFILNKSDLLQRTSNFKEVIDTACTLLKNKVKLFAGESKSFMLSSHTNLDFKEELLSKIVELTHSQTNNENPVLIQARHYEFLSKANECLQRAVYELKLNQGAEFVSITLKEALLHIQAILGKHYDDQVLDRIFKEFCLGK